MTREAATLAATCVAVSAVLAAVVRDVRRSRRPLALLREGRWVDARVAAEALAASWMRVLPRVGDDLRYLVALTRHFEGDLVGARRALAALTPRDASLRYAARSLEAACLVLEDGDPIRALAAVREARDARAAAGDAAERADDAIVEANVLRALGRDDEADARARAAAAVPTHRAPSSPLARLEDAAFRYFLGRDLLARGREEDARAELARALAEAPGSVYGARADALLATLVRPRDDDASADAERSSLAPQVVSAKASRPPRA